jgi:hypothetical protein
MDDEKPLVLVRQWFKKEENSPEATVVIVSACPSR